MKAGDKFCGYTRFSGEYFEIEVLRKSPGIGPWWEVLLKRPEGNQESCVRMSEGQILHIIERSIPANLDNV